MIRIGKLAAGAAAGAALVALALPMAASATTASSYTVSSTATQLFDPAGGSALPPGVGWRQFDSTTFTWLPNQPIQNNIALHGAFGTSGNNVTITTTGTTAIESRRGVMAQRGATSAMYPQGVDLTGNSFVFTTYADGMTSGTAWDRGTITFHFDTPVTNPMLNIAGIGNQGRDRTGSGITAHMNAMLRPTNGQSLEIVGSPNNLSVTNGYVDTPNPADYQCVTTPGAGSAGCGSVIILGTGTEFTLEVGLKYQNPNQLTFGDQWNWDQDTDSYNISLSEVSTATATAMDDSAGTQPGVAVNGNVLTNDALPGTPTSVTKLSDPTNGTLVFNSDGTYIYTPNSGFTGTDSFTYQVVVNGLTVTGTVSINVQAAAVPASSGSAPAMLASTGAEIVPTLWGVALTAALGGLCIVIASRLRSNRRN